MGNLHGKLHSPGLSAYFFSAWSKDTDITSLRVWFFTLAFVSIGLSFRVAGLRQAGWRPVVVFRLGVVFNALIELLVAYILFWVFAIGS